MRNDNSNHKPKRYTFPLPLILRSESPILITDGEGRLLHKGDIIIRSADTQSVQFETQKSIEETQEKLFTFVPKTILRPEPSIPDEYVRFREAEAKTASYGRGRSIYEYHKRERDMSYIALIKRNGDVRQINLGSLFEPDSILGIALKEFSREKPFYRRDLKPERMPHGLRQGQRIKACLDILSYERFLDKTEVLIGKKKKTSRYIRTPKQLP